ncbi:MAG: hypothetical protein MZV70_68455 [Desulfobacterales bacterium]|nr:hypothetical protein [Desulfobacterales bacterium]
MTGAPRLRAAMSRRRRTAVGLVQTKSTIRRRRPGAGSGETPARRRRRAAGCFARLRAAPVQDAPQPRPSGSGTHRSPASARSTRAVLDQIEELLITADVGVADRHRADRAHLTAARRRRRPMSCSPVAARRDPGHPDPATPGRPARHGGRAARHHGGGGQRRRQDHHHRQARRAVCRRRPESVLIAAADTFRAAAVDQLAIWAERAGADLVRHQDGTDPAAGRLRRRRSGPRPRRGCRDRRHRRPAAHQGQPDGGDQEGQALHRQAAAGRTARRAAGPGRDHRPERRFPGPAVSTRRSAVTGIALTKLDGTAKGGIVIAICQAFDIPLRYIGIGEAIEDLQDFDPRAVRRRAVRS